MDEALLLHALEKAGLKTDLMEHEGNAWRLRHGARRVKELLSHAGDGRRLELMRWVTFPTLRATRVLEQTGSRRRSTAAAWAWPCAPCA